jgi:3-methylfumaryl-CoA hydratase
METAAIARQSQRDALDPARADALAAALGLPQRFGTGDPLPPFFHQIWFWTPQPPDNLGRDGHPKVGGLIPDMGLPRRMWAGGRLAFHAPLLAGLTADKTSRVETAQHKTGRSGRLGFVTLRHDITQDGAPRVTEWQDLVYRADPGPNTPRPVPPQAPPAADATEAVAFDETLLFRYSALTFNGHRIHYDAAYAREVEGYAGLVVHGPLLAQLLMLMAEAQLGPLSGFSFRATAPLILGRQAWLCRAGTDLWVAGEGGIQHMSAQATPSE